MELSTCWDIAQGKLIRVLEPVVARIAKDPWRALQSYHFGSNSTNAASPCAGQGRKAGLCNRPGQLFVALPVGWVQQEAAMHEQGSKSQH